MMGDISEVDPNKKQTAFIHEGQLYNHDDLVFFHKHLPGQRHDGILEVLSSFHKSVTLA
jgi:hypothetical protein